METLSPEEVKEKLTDLDRRQRESAGRKKQFEDGLSLHRGYVKQAEERRKRLVEDDLVSDDPATVAWAQNEIDQLDIEIATDRRLVEAHSAAVAKATIELEQVNREWKALDEQVEAQERAEKFEAWKVKQTGRYNTATELLDGVRLALGDLCIGNREGVEEFGPQAHQVIIPLTESFMSRQMNLDSRGFQDRYDWAREEFSFIVRPQSIRKESK